MTFTDESDECQDPTWTKLSAEPLLLLSLQRVESNLQNLCVGC